MDIKQATKELANVVKKDYKKASKKKVKKIYSVISMRNFMKRKFVNTPLIEGLINKGEISLLAGHSGIGKSFFAMIMASELAKGGEFLKFKCQRKIILYLDRENRAYSRQMRLKKISKTPLSNIYFSELDDEMLDYRENVNRLISTCKKNKIDIVVFDTLKRFFSFEENSADSVNQLYLNVLKPIRDANISIFIIHHLGKSGKVRGSSDIEGLTDNNFTMKRDKKGVLWLNIEKARDRERESIAFNLNITEKSANIEVLRNIGADRVKTKADDMAGEIYSILKRKKKPMKRKEIATKLKVDARRDSCLRRALEILKQNDKIESISGLYDIKKPRIKDYDNKKM